MPRALQCPPALLSQDLSGKTYIVTGANSGIGKVTVGQLSPNPNAHDDAAAEKLDAVSRNMVGLA